MTRQYKQLDIDLVLELVHQARWRYQDLATAFYDRDGALHVSPVSFVIMVSYMAAYRFSWIGSCMTFNVSNWKRKKAIKVP